MDQPKVERMLRLMAMMSGNVDYTIAELADSLDASSRSIYRYIDTFKKCGFVVVKQTAQVYKLKTMPNDYLDFSKLIYFSEEEAYLVNNLIDRLAPANALKATLQKKLAVIYDSTCIADYVPVKSNAANVEALGVAVRSKCKAVLKNYESGNSHTVRDRYVEPFGFTANYVDVWAYDIEDGRNKTFKIARIGEAVAVVDEPWAYEEAHERQGMDIFGMSGSVAMPVKLRLSMLAKNLLLEEHPLAERDLHRRGREWLLDTSVYNYAGICRFYVGVASDARIVKSPDFAAYVDDFVSKNLIHSKK